MHRVTSSIGSEFIRKTKWHFFHIRKRTPFFHQILLSAFAVRDTSIPYDSGATHCGAFLDHVVCAESQADALGKRMIRHFKKNPRFILGIIAQTIRLRAKKEKKWKAAERRSYSNCSADQLADHLTSYVADILEFRLSLAHPLFMERELETMLASGLKRHFGTESAQWYQAAVTPADPGLAVEEELALCTLALRGKSSRRAIREHVLRFGHMANVRYDGSFYDERQYASRLSAMIPRIARERIAELRDSCRKNKHALQKLLRELRRRGDRNLALLVQTANKSVFFRSYRQEIWYGSMLPMIPLFREIAKRLSFSDFRDCFYHYWDELDRALRTDAMLDPHMRTLRKKGYSFLCLQDGGGYAAWDGKDANAMCAAFQQSLADSIPAGDEIIGAGAYPGLVRARAYVAHSIDELKNLPRGDVLVTHATNVNMVPFLKKCSAIVTEEGGILSHASIISRELKIPCVIGTKVATRVFKTGERIEVDAKNGVVKKL